jgi:hypothetical protein
MTDAPSRSLDSIQRALSVFAQLSGSMTVNSQRVLLEVMRAEAEGRPFVTQAVICAATGLQAYEVSLSVKYLTRGTTKPDYTPRMIGGLVENKYHRGRPSQVSLTNFGREFMQLLQEAKDATQINTGLPGLPAANDRVGDGAIPGVMG